MAYCGGGKNKVSLLLIPWFTESVLKELWKSMKNATSTIIHLLLLLSQIWVQSCTALGKLRKVKNP